MSDASAMVYMDATDGKHKCQNWSVLGRRECLFTAHTSVAPAAHPLAPTPPVVWACLRSAWCYAAH